MIDNDLYELSHDDLEEYQAELARRSYQAQSERIEKLKFENKLMDEALMQIAALPTQGGALARQLIKDIQEQTENKEVSDD